MEQKAKRIGKFNVVDIIAVILILAVVAFAGYKLMDDEPAAPSQKETVKLTYVALAQGVSASLYEGCQQYLPSPLMASGALIGGQIDSVEKRPYLVVGPDGQLVEDPNRVNLYFTVTTETAVQDVMVNKVGEQEIRIGRGHVLKSEYIELQGTVIVDMKLGE